mmetsp:Transcript_7018/g.12502  ORF Transcript_7018/g.12502 Transcript_7018/m.12502 type:complete len:299 (-) Transcript_7018:1529-2425(-)
MLFTNWVMPPSSFSPNSASRFSTAQSTALENSRLYFSYAWKTAVLAASSKTRLARNDRIFSSCAVHIPWRCRTFVDFFVNSTNKSSTRALSTCPLCLHLFWYTNTSSCCMATRSLIATIFCFNKSFSACSTWLESCSSSSFRVQKSISRSVSWRSPWCILCNESNARVVSSKTRVCSPWLSCSRSSLLAYSDHSDISSSAWALDAVWASFSKASCFINSLFSTSSCCICASRVELSFSRFETLDRNFPIISLASLLAGSTRHVSPQCVEASRISDFTRARSNSADFSFSASLRFCSSS